MINGAKSNQTQLEEYLAMGLELLPSGRVNEHKYYKIKYGVCSVKDSTWDRKKHWHTCCKSKRAYRHLAGCENRKRISEVNDDYSDLKDIC